MAALQARTRDLEALRRRMDSDLSHDDGVVVDLRTNCRWTHRFLYVYDDAADPESNVTLIQNFTLYSTVTSTDPIVATRVTGKRHCEPTPLQS